MCVCVCAWVHVCALHSRRNIQRSDPLELEFQVSVCWEPNKPAARASNTAELYPQLFFLFMHSKTAANGIMLLLRVGFPSSEFSGTPSHDYKVRLLDDSQVKLTMKINLHDNQVRPHQKANQNSPTKTSPQRSYQPFLQ